jgi:hypothetical protein
MVLRASTVRAGGGMFLAAHFSTTQHGLQVTISRIAGVLLQAPSPCLIIVVAQATFHRKLQASPPTVAPTAVARRLPSPATAAAAETVRRVFH